MSKKKKQGKLRHITIAPSEKDMESNISDQLWFEQHPEYGGRLRPYIPGEFDGIFTYDDVNLDALEYVYVKNMGGVHRARIPYTLDPLESVTLIILGSVDEDDLNTVLSMARRLTTHAEVVPDSMGNHKLLAFCTAAQKPMYEDFIQYVFAGAKRYQG